MGSTGCDCERKEALSQTKPISSPKKISMASYLFQLEPEEKLIFDETGVWHKSKWQAFLGQLYLTNKRVLFVKNPPPLFGGVLGLFLKQYRRQLTHDIPVDSLRTYHNEKFGRNKKVIVLEGKDSENFKFTTSKAYEIWDAKLKELGVS
jgi:hypothetical protein